MWDTSSARPEAADLPTFTRTPYGVLAHVPVLEYLDETHAILLLFGDAHEAYGIHLLRCLDADARNRLLYHTDDSYDCRIVHLTLDAQRYAVPVWKDIYLTDAPPFRAEQAPLPSSLKFVNISPSSPFQVTKDIVDLGDFKLVEVSAIPFGWAGSPPLALLYSSILDDRFVVKAGWCAKEDTHWATLTMMSAKAGASKSYPGSPANESPRSPAGAGWKRLEEPVSDAHRCPKDHVVGWRHGGGEGGQRWRAFTLRFSQVTLEVRVTFAEWMMAREEGRTLTMGVAIERK